MSANKIFVFVSYYQTMYVLEMMERNCLHLANTLHDDLYIEECRKIQTTNISTSVMEFAASTIIAHLTYHVNKLFNSSIALS